MEFDTGASVSILPKRIWSEIGKPRLYPSHALKTYGGHVLDAIGSVKVMATLNERSQMLWATVLDTAGQPLFGRTFLRVQFETVRIDRTDKSTLNNDDKIRDLLDCYSGLFEPSTTCVKNFEVKLTLNCDAIPQCRGSRRVPFAMREAIETEFNRQLKLVIIEQIDTAHEHVDWAAPVVIARKPDGSDIPSISWMRLHVDFAGPIGGQMYLAVIDGYSQWPEIVEVRNTYANETTDRIGLGSYVVSTEEGELRRRHVDDLRRSQIPEVDDVVKNRPEGGHNVIAPLTKEPANQENVLRRSYRTRKAPVRYDELTVDREKRDVAAAVRNSLNE
ncbi:hypothetical protein GJ496_004061 [Pomphorhynchus laevis]|nr:hypothetical protein GJ496_004061 [Pomphorhynchus laevis]